MKKSETLLTKLTDAQLVEMYINGNNQAFAEICSKYRGSVFVFLLSLSQDEYLADDLTQDVFVRAMEVLKSSYKEEGSLLPWLKRIARNMFIDYFRQKSKRNNSNSLLGEEVWDLADSEPNKEREIITLETEKEIQALITSLPIEQQKVVIARMYKRIMFKDIAEMESIPINTALGRFRYGLRNMRKVYFKEN
ncbi:MAG: sigma-70 family RNA polymerase sigma factor [Candidatus Pacebacteria bacterium]|nr:sigma-70 family RNA polymerase sigma factor [Candidatus Paceibacterota bacterium]